MPRISVLSPLDQPLGNRRLLQDLKRCLKDEDLSEFGFSVAFAKVGPLFRLQELIQAWRSEGKSATAIFGIDHNGTSVQALQFAIEHLDSAFYAQYRGHSFHPKIYWFKGNSKAVAFVGSNNMTVGGTELNFEAAIELEFKLPEEQAAFDQVHQMFTSLLPDTCPATRELTAEALAQLEADGLLLDETKKSSGTGWAKRKVAHPPNGGFKLPVKPASSLPSHVVFGKVPKKKDLAKKAEALKVQADTVDVTKPLVPVSGFAIQIKPHHNGAALTHDRAKSDPFAGNPRFRRWGGQIGGGWRQVSAGWAGGVRSVKRVSIGGRRSGPIAVRGFPGTLNAAWNGSWGRPGQVTRVAGERVWREARASAQDRARGQRRNFG